MKGAIINCTVSLASGAGAWFIGAMQNIEATFRFIGVVAGSLTACVTFALAIRKWRAKSEK